VQMGGWFNKQINTLDDLKGLKMRIPGWGGEVLRRAGGTPVRLPAAEIFTALQTGAIDATEWIGPYNDRSLGLHQAARYYYYPGWHEPGPVLECIVNKQAFATLPKDLQTIVEIASSALNDQMTAEYTAKNAQALEDLRSEGKVELRRFPDDVLRGLRELNRQVVEELIAEDAFAARVNESFQKFTKTVSAWTEISEQAFLEIRSL
jgi:TRAP-type mannitol/chloroaromatic compound transport system substrate-binding protein